MALHARRTSQVQVTGSRATDAVRSAWPRRKLPPSVGHYATLATRNLKDFEGGVALCWPILGGINTGGWKSVRVTSPACAHHRQTDRQPGPRPGVRTDCAPRPKSRVDGPPVLPVNGRASREKACPAGAFDHQGGVQHGGRATCCTRRHRSGIGLAGAKRHSRLLCLNDGIARLKPAFIVSR